MSSSETIEREFNSLRLITDNYPKYVLSMDKHQQINNEGIIRMNLIDFLLEFESKDIFIFSRHIITFQKAIK